MDELLSKVKANLILEHTADDELLKGLHHRRCFLRRKLPAHPGGLLHGEPNATDHRASRHYAVVPLL